MNTSTLMGRITAPLELRYSPSGTGVLNFTVAVDRGRKNTDGERETDFIPCVAFNKTAELIAQFFDKGRMIAVRGSIQIRKWVQQDGQKREKAEIVVDSFYFCGDKAKSSAEPALPETDETEGFDPFANND